VDQSSAKKFFTQRGRVLVDLVFSDVRNVYPLRRYWRSKSKVVRNRAEIWKFFGPPKFLGQVFQKLYTHYHRCLAARRLEKFREDIPTSPEVIEAHALNFKQNLKISQLIFWVTPVPVGVCAIDSLVQSLARLKISWRCTP